VEYSSSSAPIYCFFCGRNLSAAATIQYTAEGPTCSMCLAKMGPSSPVFVQERGYWDGNNWVWPDK